MLWVLERGGVLGQQAIFGRSRPTTAIATTDAVTIQLLGETCARMLERNPRILYGAFEMFEARLEKLTQALEDVMLLDVPSRLAKYILDSGEDSRTHMRSRSLRTRSPPQWARHASR